jgi:hypothetical protein
MTGTERRRRKVIWSLVVMAWLLAAPAAADAYIGPGAGISVIGTALAFVGAVIFVIVGFVWYPLKRLVVFVKSIGAREDDDEKASLS